MKTSRAVWMDTGHICVGCSRKAYGVGGQGKGYVSRFPLLHGALTLALSIEAPVVLFPGWALLLQNVVMFLVNELKEKVCLPVGRSGWLYA